METTNVVPVATSGAVSEVGNVNISTEPTTKDIAVATVLALSHACSSNFSQTTLAGQPIQEEDSSDHESERASGQEPEQGQEVEEGARG